MNEKGLYRQQFEHDACGIGAVVNVDGTKTHTVVDNALSIGWKNWSTEPERTLRARRATALEYWCRYRTNFSKKPQRK